MSFNPCSVGSCSGRVPDSTSPTRSSVSILVLLDHARGGQSGSWAVVGKEFQSLFCWIMLGEIDNQTSNIMNLMFQSLFCWIMLGELLSLCTFGMAPLSFNPCSVGSCSGSWFFSGGCKGLVLFQSLFCWIMLGERALIKTLKTYYAFQSLFCWIMLGEKPVTVTIGEAEGFNPCSVGSCSGRRLAFGKAGIVDLFQSLFCWIMLGESPADIYPPRGAAVSILVLLDHARGDGHREGSSGSL